MAKRATRRGAVQKDQHSSGFTLASLTQLAAIPIITGGITLVGFYYSTNSQLARYSDELKAISSSVATKTADDSAQREKIRDSFLQLQAKTNEGIAKLDTRLAVAEAQQATTNQTLVKISDTLERISTMGKR